MSITTTDHHPFGQLAVDLSDSELRETAYEIFVGACRSSGGTKPLTFVSSGERKPERRTPATLLQRAVTASKVKKALGLRSLSDSVATRSDSGREIKEGVRVGELIRVQMRVSDQVDIRVRRGFLKIAASQLGRRIESLVIPLELLQHFSSSDFSSRREYEAWQRRLLKVLEAGLVYHPHLPLEKTNTAAKQLQEFVRGALEGPIETGRHSEALHTLRDIVMLLASKGSVSDICHWADGVPLNLKLYQILLEACFDVNEAASVIEEVDEVLELIKKTWVILGISQPLHNLCFLWVLFHRHVVTGEVENDLLFAADNLLLEVEKDAKAIMDSAYSKVLRSTLSLILGWAEKKLKVYHENFYTGNIDIMQSVLSLSVSTAKVLVEENGYEYHRKRKEVDVARGRVDTYIRSSVRNAFSQEREKIYLSRRARRHEKDPLPVLSVLAQDISDVAFNEKEIYSPILKRWHPLATGVAVATLHACYGNELKQFVLDNNELTPDSIQVLLAADKLEKDLVQMAVEDSVDSEDGGKSIIQEMTPYEAEGVIMSLAKSWIRTRTERLTQKVDRFLQQEVWDPEANKEHFAPSALEVMRIVDGTLDAFFLLPIPTHHILLSDLMSCLDECLRHYIINAKSGCGSRTDFVPKMPALTRCTSGFSGIFKKKEKLVQRRTAQVEDGDNNIGVQQLCVRMNTLHHIRKGLEALEKKIIAQLKGSGSAHLDKVIGKTFELSRTTCLEGVQQLSLVTAHKVVFHNLRDILWDGLYLGEVSSSRIEPFLQELEKYLEIISSTAHDRVRTRLIADVMKASFDGFLLVLLAGGPNRAFTVKDAVKLEEDFKFVTDLFWSGGDGLPADLIDRFAVTVRRVLPLFHTDTESLIEQFRGAMLDEYGSFAKSMLPLPPTSGQWNPAEPDTILRVLCHRNDKLATSFLKKTYNLPKKL